MTKIQASIDDIAKPKIEIALSARLMTYEANLPQFFIATYNLDSQNITLHGANTVEELNLTLSYFPDDALMAIIPSEFEDGPSANERNNDTVADFVADPELPGDLEYDMSRKEFILNEEELEAIAKRDGELADHGNAMKGKFGLAVHTNTNDPIEKPQSQQPTQRGHLKLVVDNDI